MLSKIDVHSDLTHGVSSYSVIYLTVKASFSNDDKEQYQQTSNTDFHFYHHILILIMEFLRRGQVVMLQKQQLCPVVSHPTVQIFSLSNAVI